MYLVIESSSLDSLLSSYPVSSQTAADFPDFKRFWSSSPQGEELGVKLEAISNITSLMMTTIKQSHQQRENFISGSKIVRSA
jgi:hypothetical protein